MGNGLTRARKLVVLGTGGTIAGRAAQAQDSVSYTAGQVAVEDLLSGIETHPGMELVAEQVAQVDSKDMSFELWRELALRCAHWLADADVAGIVITHGTDTLEETAYFLHRVLAPTKPVVLTCAMRPATAFFSDGPQNLRDAIVVAATPNARGTCVVCAGVVHGAVGVRKSHTYRLDAFDSGDLGPIGYVEEGAIRLTRDWPAAPAGEGSFNVAGLPRASSWPRVEIVTSHAGARAALIDALVQMRAVDGLVLAGTGNGTLHKEIEAAALRAQDAGVDVVRATRCANGRLLPHADRPLRDAEVPSPVKARIALILELLAQADASA